MFDIGKTLEPTLAQQIDELSQHNFLDWPKQKHQSLLNKSLPNKAKMPNLKRLFGSDYIYEDVAQDSFKQNMVNQTLYASQSFGGFSKVWELM